MSHPSPITPIPASRPEPLFGLGADASHAVATLVSADGDRTSSRRESRDRAAAALLSVGAAVIGADAIARPLLDASVLPHPVVHGAVIGVMLMTALGVRLGWRPARRVARVIGYGLALGAYTAYQRMTGDATSADLWVAAVLAAEAGSLGFMMNHLGWVTDED